ncbi:MAG: porin [Acidobacteriota bacterium]
MPQRFVAQSSSLPGVALLLVACFALSTPAAASDEAWKLTSKDGESFIKFGFLGVMRGEAEDQPNGETAENLFFRRLRLMFGGQIADKWTFFMETDSPNLGKSDSNGQKNSGEIFIQDFFVTYTHSSALKLDAGLILIPISRNSTQSAATHLTSDYGPFSFLNSGPTNSRVGRDYGLQARGTLADAKFEYRLGIYDGNRGDDAAEDFRYAGRVMYHVFDPEPAMFYTGNTLGAKRHLSFGASFDVQDDYTAIGADVFYDQPVGESDAFTVQADWIRYDGGDTFASLPEQDTRLLEVGYYFGRSRWQPWVQYADRDFADDLLGADEERFLGGVNYRLKKHNRVLRLAYGQISRDGEEDRDVAQLTLQIFKF